MPHVLHTLKIARCMLFLMCNEQRCIELLHEVGRLKVEMVGGIYNVELLVHGGGGGDVVVGAMEYNELMLALV